MTFLVRLLENQLRTLRGTGSFSKPFLAGGHSEIRGSQEAAKAGARQEPPILSRLAIKVLVMDRIPQCAISTRMGPPCRLPLAASCEPLTNFHFITLPSRAWKRKPRKEIRKTGSRSEGAHWVEDAPPCVVSPAAKPVMAAERNGMVPTVAPAVLRISFLGFRERARKARRGLGQLSVPLRVRSWCPKSLSWFSIFLLVGCIQQANPRRGVIQVMVSQQLLNLDAPWQAQKPKTRILMGSIVNYEGAKTPGILVPASGILYAKRLEAKVYGEHETLPLEIYAVNEEVDLALLTFPSKVPSGLHPLALGDSLPIGGRGDAVAWEADLAQWIRTPVELESIEMVESHLSAYTVPQYIFQSSRGELSQREPVVEGATLLAILTTPSGNGMAAIPIRVIHQFLKNPKAGVPSFAFSTQKMEDPQLRAYYEIPPAQEGVRITEVDPRSGWAGGLQPGDLLVAVEGYPVDRKGNIPHPQWGLVPYSILLSSFSSSQKLTITKWSFMKSSSLATPHGIKSQHKAVLPDFSSNEKKIPYYLTPEAERRHLIFGGVVFQELSLAYLRAWGPNWKQTAPIAYVHAWTFGNQKSTDRIVVVGQILSDPFNTGYEGMGEEVVTQLNGKPATSLEAIADALHAPILRNGESFAVIELAHGRGDIILPYGGLSSAHERLKENWRLDAASFWSPR